jgi:serine/threonine-protein kinase
MLGRYALHEKIASGGMASVHLARLLGPIGFARTVAIKRMHPQLADDPTFVSMFLDEARLAARISHPNVVATLDVVQTDGELFLVMEYVRGESLGRLIKTAVQRGERIPPAMASTIMVGVLHGLHAAHEATNDQGEPLGLVHRDVSPHNVLVGIDGIARVLDFGVAKASGRIQTTSEGQLKGKLGYMAPEQVRGDVSRRTDVYAASVTFWETLTGARLFKGDNEAQILDGVLKGATVPPSKHVPNLPGALDDVVMRGLSLDPAARFATAREMARALEDATLPMMAPSKVGDWVAEAARETLAERSALIARIESDSSVSYRRSTHPRPVAPADEGSVATESVVVTQLSSGAVSISQERPVAKKRGPKWILALAGAGVVAVFAGWLLLHRSTPSESSAQPASAPPSADSVAIAPTAPVSAATPTDPAPAASATAAASSSSAAPTKPAPARRAQPAPPKPPSACNPPWYYDSRGARVFKQECL